MFNAWDCRERPPEEGAAAGLQGFGVDKNFLSSLKGILLETELVTATSPTWCLCLSHPDPCRRPVLASCAHPFTAPSSPRHTFFNSGLSDVSLETVTTRTICCRTEVRGSETWVRGGERISRKEAHCLPPASRRVTS